MAYEYEIKIPMWLEDGRWLNMNVDDEVLEELEEVYRKAKTLDEVKNFTTERLKEQKHTDEYDFGERLMCEEIEEIIGGQTK